MKKPRNLTLETVFTETITRRAGRISIIVTLTLVVCLIGTAQAQLVPRRSVDQILDAPIPGSVQQSELQNSLQALKDETDRLKSTLIQAKEKASFPTPEIVPLIDDQETAGTDDIYDRIRLLQDIMKKEEAESRKTALNPPQVNQLRSTTQKTPPKLPQETVDQMTNYEGQLTTAATDEKPNEFNISGERVLPVPVNTFELGNSLFQTGNIKTALETYQSIDRAELTAFDSKWLDLMIANCHRRLENWDDAASSYREIANEKNQTNLTDASSWWLKHIEQKEKSKSAFENMKADVDKLIEQATQHVQQ